MVTELNRDCLVRPHSYSCNCYLLIPWFLAVWLRSSPLGPLAVSFYPDSPLPLQSSSLGSNHLNVSDNWAQPSNQCVCWIIIFYGSCWSETKSLCHITGGQDWSVFGDHVGHTLCSFYWPVHQCFSVTLQHLFHHSSQVVPHCSPVHWQPLEAVRPAP